MAWFRALFLLNLLVSVASALAATIAVVRPGILSHSAKVTQGERFYSRMYAARSIPLGLIAGLLPLIDTGRIAIVLLLTVALVQAVDVVVAAVEKKRPHDASRSCRDDCSASNMFCPVTHSQVMRSARYGAKVRPACGLCTRQRNALARPFL